MLQQDMDILSPVLIPMASNVTIAGMVSSAVAPAIFYCGIADQTMTHIASKSVSKLVHK